MFAVTEADAAAIRAVFHEDGELSAAIEVRRRFPGITENVNAPECARIHRRDAARCRPVHGDAAAPRPGKR